jgi:hypothetical protein
MECRDRLATITSKKAERLTMKTVSIGQLVLFLFLVHSSYTEPINPVVVIEEEVCTVDPADNGAGPMWCRGNTCVVRDGDNVFASCIKTIPEFKPLNNCLPQLFQRTKEGWEEIFSGKGRTREPNPLAVFQNGNLLLSVNPTLTEPDDHSGPAEPKIYQFDPKTGKQLETLQPVWDGKPGFSEHSYRSFVVDGKEHELFLLQNIGYKHAEWAFRDASGKWSAQGQLEWPFEEKYDKPQHARLCYPAVALKDRAVYFFGVSDIIEPYDKWREYKFKLTGRKWDYDFRRLFYTWSDDITTGKFHDWIEIASRDKTCGWMTPWDLYISPNNEIYLLWTDRALDERLREEFFPNEKQHQSLRYAIVKNGKIQKQCILTEWNEGKGGEQPGGARFHVDTDGRLYVVYYVRGTSKDGQSFAENRIVRVGESGIVGNAVSLQVKNPLSNFFTNTIRAGCLPSNRIDLFGQLGKSMRYIQINLH